MTWIHTHTGRAVDLVRPRPEDICLEDIAHALAHQCRYTGHAKRFFSVAEHSVLCADQIYHETGIRSLAWSGLMHDAHEAYTGDVASPIKACLGDAWRSFESRLERAVSARYGVFQTHETRLADLRALHTEREQVLPWPPPQEWLIPHAEKYPGGLLFWTPSQAKVAFLSAVTAYAPHQDILEEATAIQRRVAGK